MAVLGIDIGKTHFDAHLLADGQAASVRLANTQSGFAALRDWLIRHGQTKPATLHACMEATGNYGLDLASFLYAQGYQVSIVNPKQIRAFGMAELRRNKTDKLDAALIARFCRAQNPPLWTPPLPHMLALREAVRRCAALKQMRTAELNRQKAGFSSEAVRASIQRNLDHLNAEIDTVAREIPALITQNPELRRRVELLCSIPGIGETTAIVLLAELPNIADFEAKGLAAFAGLSPAEHSSGAQTKHGGITRIGNPTVRSACYLGALSATRHNPRLTDFVRRLNAAGKPKKLILVAVARKLLVLAHAVIRTNRPFDADHVDANTANA
jgi:transposase